MLKVNDHVITPTIFPDGTSQVWKLPPEVVSSPHPLVTWVFESESEIIQVQQLLTLLTASHVDLCIPYLPYARQDKDISNDSTFALHSFARWLNSIPNISYVTAFDPHSDVARDSIACFLPTRPDGLIQRISDDFDYICYPDEGAAKRYRINSTAKPLYGKKVRDQSTGKITSYEITNAESIRMGSTVLVVDDICDGGATFILLGSTLQCYRMKASLYVSHGIFSNGIEILRGYYDRIITTDSRPIKHKELTVYESAPPHRLLQG